MSISCEAGKNLKKTNKEICDIHEQINISEAKYLTNRVSLPSVIKPEEKSQFETGIESNDNFRWKDIFN